MTNTMSATHEVENALSKSHADPFSKRTTDLYDPVRKNFLQQSASYLGADLSSSQVLSIINSHTTVQLN